MLCTDRFHEEETDYVDIMITRLLIGMLYILLVHGLLFHFIVCWFHFARYHHVLMACTHVDSPYNFNVTLEYEVPCILEPIIMPYCLTICYIQVALGDQPKMRRSITFFAFQTKRVTCFHMFMFVCKGPICCDDMYCVMNPCSIPLHHSSVLFI